MKRLIQGTGRGLVVGFGMILLMTEPAVSQWTVGGTLGCASGLEEGDLGLSGIDCVGECTLTIREDGADQSWFFSTEPRVFGVDRGGPAEGVLRAGDFLVAIDGILITTREGGRRFANLPPGETVSVRFRRDGRMGEGMIEVGARCREVPERVSVTTRVPPVAPLPSPAPDRPRPVAGVVVAPRVRVAPTRRSVGVVEGVETVVREPIRATRGLLSGVSPTGRLGVGFQCTECGTQTDEETGENVWFFSGPLEVTTVNVGGPAEEAGVQRGDLIKAIDGKAIDSDEGGLAFTHITPGESIRMTLLKRNGSEVEVSLVPEESTTLGIPGGLRSGIGLEPLRSTGVAVSPDPPTPLAGTVRPPRPTAPDLAEPLAPTARLAPPEGMPLRYSGSVNGVEVEVWGNPVTVSEMRGERTLYINAEGLWIRITIPGEGDPSADELVGRRSPIRR